MKTQPVSKEVFDKLTPSERRVAIAKDVIEQVEGGRYWASSGNWCNMYEPKKCHTLMASEEGQELQPVINEANCAVCALGAVFASAVGLYDNCKVTGSMRTGLMNMADLYKLLSNHFEASQLVAIEIAYERGKGGNQWFGLQARKTNMLGDEADRVITYRLFKIRYAMLNNPKMLEQLDSHAAEELTELFDAAVEFIRYPGGGERNRMIGIMNNIIYNNGEFKP